MNVRSAANAAVELRHTSFSLASQLVLRRDVTLLGPCSHYSTDSSYSLVTVRSLFTSEGFHTHVSNVLVNEKKPFNNIGQLQHIIFIVSVICRCF